MGDKRYFEMIDDGSIRYWIVATDIDHARNILSKHVGDTFGPAETSLAAAEQIGAIKWTEMGSAEAASRKIVDEDNRRILGRLSECNLGDWFCSEW